MNGPLRYQSPIELGYNNNLFCIKQNIKIKGKNCGAKFNPDNKTFVPENKITIKIDDKKYRLDEYHFHVPAEHIIDKKTYPAEVHYVFYDVSKSKKHETKNMDVCACQNTEDEDILVIGRVINNSCKHNKLSKIAIDIPDKYFEYDGSLTGTGDETTPVRWIVGVTPIKISLEEIKKVAKTARTTQPLDDRIILYSSKC